MKKDALTRAEELARRLTEHGHEDHARKIEAALAHDTEHAVLLGLRDACQTVLTWVEAFDPVTIGMAEELRIALDKEFGTTPPEGTPATK